MINNEMMQYGKEPSVIREIFAFGLLRKMLIGEDNVFDFSIGNPNVPVPREINECIENLTTRLPSDVHGYTASKGNIGVLEIIANNLEERFGLPVNPDQLYLVGGAAGALASSFKAISHPGDEIVVIAPFFPEYRVWIESIGCTCVPVPAKIPTFQPDVEAIERSITPRTCAIVVNSPNNPTGAVYTRSSLERLCGVLRRKAGEYGHPIYLISDEPYRELTYGAKVTWIPKIYDDTIVCYSWSKCFSLPGERIGYVYVNDRMENARDVIAAVAGAGRSMGYVNAPSLFQYVIAQCIDAPVNLAPYWHNRRALTKGMRKLGYEYVEPDGAFYLWVRALEKDAEAFCERAKEYELLLVPSNSFGIEGWVRIGYCTDYDTIMRSLPAFKRLMASYRKK